MGGFSKLKTVQGWSLVTPAPAPPPPPPRPPSEPKAADIDCWWGAALSGGRWLVVPCPPSSLMATHSFYSGLSCSLNTDTWTLRPTYHIITTLQQCTKVNGDQGAVYTETHSVIIVICYTDHSRNRVLSLFSEYTV